MSLPKYLELEPCPCCGEPASIWTDTTYPDNLSYHVFCVCGIRTEPMQNKEDAVKVWNNRVNDWKLKIADLALEQRDSQKAMTAHRNRVYELDKEIDKALADECDRRAGGM